MAVFRSIYLWFSTLSSLIMLTSALPVNISSEATTFNSTITDFPIDKIPYFTPIYNPDYNFSSNASSNIDSHSLEKRHNCPPLNKGLHNCDKMLEECNMYFEKNWPPGHKMRVNYHAMCRGFLCMQTFGDCNHWSCLWPCPPY